MIGKKDQNEKQALLEILWHIEKCLELAIELGLDRSRLPLELALAQADEELHALEDVETILIH